MRVVWRSQWVLMPCAATQGAVTGCGGVGHHLFGDQQGVRYRFGPLLGGWVRLVDALERA